MYTCPLPCLDPPSHVFLIATIVLRVPSSSSSLTSVLSEGPWIWCQYNIIIIITTTLIITTTTNITITITTAIIIILWGNR